MPLPENDISVGGVRSREQIIGLGAYWVDVRMAYLDGSLIYKGCHFRHNAEVTDDDWEIWKYTWSDGDLVRVEGPLPGAWSNRDGLEWG